MNVLSLCAALSAYLLSPLPTYRKKLHALVIVCAAVTLCFSLAWGALALLFIWLRSRSRTSTVRYGPLNQAQAAHIASTASVCMATSVTPQVMWAVLSRSGDEHISHIARGVLREFDAGGHVPTVYGELAERERELRAVLALFIDSYDSGASVTAGVTTLATDMLTREHDAVVESVRTIGVKATLPLGGCFLPAFIVLGVVPLAASLI